MPSSGHGDGTAMARLMVMARLMASLAIQVTIKSRLSCLLCSACLAYALSSLQPSPSAPGTALVSCFHTCTPAKAYLMHAGYRWTASAERNPNASTPLHAVQRQCPMHGPMWGAALS